MATRYILQLKCVCHDEDLYLANKELFNYKRKEGDEERL